MAVATIKLSVTVANTRLVVRVAITMRLAVAVAYIRLAVTVATVRPAVALATIRLAVSVATIRLSVLIPDKLLLCPSFSFPSFLWFISTAVANWLIPGSTASFQKRLSAHTWLRIKLFLKLQLAHTRLSAPK